MIVMDVVRLFQTVPTASEHHRFMVEMKHKNFKLYISSTKERLSNEAEINMVFFKLK